MNCPRCHAEVADTATICPSCSMPLRSYTPSTFSYLPAGTPAWPASIPSQVAYEADPTAVAAKGGKLTQEKSARSASSILLVVAVLVIVPLLGAVLTFSRLHNSGQSATQTAASAGSAGGTSQTQPSTAGATPTTTSSQLPAPQSFQKLTSIASAVGLTMSYPSNWVVEPPKLSTANNYVRLYPQQQSQVNILLVINRYSTQASTSFNSANDMNQQILQVIGSETGFNNLQVAQAATALRTIGGASWSEADATYTDDSGNAMRIVSVAVQHNKMYYNIVVLIPDVYYSDAMQKYIQPMFDSIQFSA